MLPTKEEARGLLESRVKDEYQRFHGKMVALAIQGYAKIFHEDDHLWYVTGLLHDLDFEAFPDEHPRRELEWFGEWGYPSDLIHAVEAHAYGYNGFKVEPKTKLAFALLAFDEISGIFYAYKKIHPIPYGSMKAASIKKRLAEKAFAAKIDRSIIQKGINGLPLSMDEHIRNLITFFSALD